MAKKKVKLQWIVDNATRKATYKKRVKGLMKKVTELSILCGVDACAITYSPYHHQPQVWPSPIEVEQVLAAFRSWPENDQTKKVLNQENFTWQRILKARNELVKHQMKNRKNEIVNLRIQCLSGKLVVGLESKDLLDLMWAIDNQLEAVKNRIGDVRAADAFTCIDAISHVGAAASGVNTAVSGIGYVPISAIGAGDAAVGGTNSIANTSFDLAVDHLNSQLLTEQNENENMGNGLGDPLEYDVSDFWRNPYIL